MLPCGCYKYIVWHSGAWHLHTRLSIGYLLRYPLWPVSAKSCCSYIGRGRRAIRVSDQVMINILYRPRDKIYIQKLVAHASKYHFRTTPHQNVWNPCDTYILVKCLNTSPRCNFLLPVIGIVLSWLSITSIFLGCIIFPMWPTKTLIYPRILPYRC